MPTPTAFVLTVPLHRDHTARNSDVAEILAIIAAQLDTDFEHVLDHTDRDTLTDNGRIIARWNTESTPDHTPA